MDKCFLCNDSYITTNTGADIEIIDGNKLNIDYNGFQVPDINIEINFCPICGRKLRGGDNIKYKIGDVVRIKDNLQEEEEYEYEFKNTKEYMLMVKLTTGEYIKIKGNQVIDMPEVIAQRIENKEDIIVFGFTGVKRELIEWYTITEVFE